MSFIDGQKVFEKLMERDKRLRDSLRFNYQSVGEKAYKGQEITDFDRKIIADNEARLDEIDRTIKLMQQALREAE